MFGRGVFAKLSSDGSEFCGGRKLWDRQYHQLWIMWDNNTEPKSA
jgi:hypothetical protein